MGFIISSLNYVYHTLETTGTPALHGEARFPCHDVEIGEARFPCHDEETGTTPLLHGEMPDDQPPPPTHGDDDRTTGEWIEETEERPRGEDNPNGLPTKTPDGLA